MAQLKIRTVYIDDSSGLTPMDVRSRARKLARESGGLSMIMIDYPQLMRVRRCQKTGHWKLPKYRAHLSLSERVKCTGSCVISIKSDTRAES